VSIISFGLTLYQHTASAKTPDSALYVRGRHWPTMVVECGYGEAYDDLLRGTRLLLEGSEGRIGRVILVHLDNIGDSGTIESGFVEVWAYNLELRRAKGSGGHFVGLSLAAPVLLLTLVKKIYPPPQSRLSQALRFTAGQLLRNKFVDERPFLLSVISRCLLVSSE
jgi:hypothetical protein